MINILHPERQNVTRYASGTPMHANRRSDPRDRSGSVSIFAIALNPEIPLKVEVLIPELD
jgi:hypothetical protein